MMIKKLLLTTLFVFTFLPAGFCATFGNTADPSAYSVAKYSVDQANLVKFTLSEAGTVSKITMYCRNDGTAVNAKCLLYDDDGASGEPSTLLGATNAVSLTSTAGWVDFTFATPVVLSAGNYWLGHVSGGEKVWIYYATASGFNYRYDTSFSSYATPGAWDIAGDGHLADTTLAIYATYTTSTARRIIITQ